ncbi:MAG: hypothetical protein JXA21_17445 [Anaerolineae bacterium]|nr:hypothetical protein [Anaerolineae bacterium]
MNNRILSDPCAELTVIPNVVFDYIMPTLSGDAWKVLCVAIRHTFDVGTAETDRWIGLPQFMQNAGLPERRDAEKALQECMYAGYLVEHAENKTSGQPRYGLNTQFEMRVAMSEEAPAGKRAPKTPPRPEKPKKTPTTPLSDKKQETMDALVRFGHEMGVTPDPTQLQTAVQDNPAESILAWIELGQGMTHLSKAARFGMVLERLLARVPPVPLSMLGGEMEEEEGIAAASESEDEPSGTEAEVLWEKVLNALKPQMRSSLFKWFKPTKAIEVTQEALVVATPNVRTKDWLETGQLADTIQQTFATVSKGKLKLVFIVQE